MRTTITRYSVKLTFITLGLLSFTACKTIFSKKNRMPMILDMVHHNPGDKRYISQYNNPETLKKMGYNGKVYFLFDSPTLAINWDSMDPEIAPKGSLFKKWIDAKRDSLKRKFSACQKSGIKVFAMSDLILFPKKLVDKQKIKKTMGDPCAPKTEKYLRFMIEQTFRQFPSLEGLVVRIGETYLQDAPFFYGKIDHKKNPKKTIIPLIKILRDEICVKQGKTLIFRTWLSFDVNEKSYQQVCDAIEPHEKLFFSIKHSIGDFHRSHEFSKLLGKGRHQQIVEVQCAREYEGKGAYPNYIANGVIEGFEEHKISMNKNEIKSLRDVWKTGNLKGVWTWSRGGGWKGPFIKNEMWCDLNAWIMAQWGNHPEKSEESIFMNYAVERLELSKKDAEKFRKLALLSADAIIRGVSTTHKDMSPWWTRDQGIGWPKLTGNMKRNLKQKDESVEIWKQIVKLAKEIKWKDKATRRFAVSSCIYGLDLYKIYRAVIRIAYADKQKNRDEIKKWIKKYDKAWNEYKKLPQLYPDVLSTLYTKEYHLHVKPADSKINKLR
jgi:tetratricopeptide (TPR) repeat protein